MTRDDREELTDLFRAQRGRKFAIAYRMLGIVSKAEDAALLAGVHRYLRAVNERPSLV